MNAWYSVSQPGMRGQGVQQRVYSSNTRPAASVPREVVVASRVFGRRYSTKVSFTTVRYRLLFAFMVI